jgi:hypothetical protein
MPCIEKEVLAISSNRIQLVLRLDYQLMDGSIEKTQIY